MKVASSRRGSRSVPRRPFDHVATVQPSTVEGIDARGLPVCAAVHGAVLRPQPAPGGWQRRVEYLRSRSCRSGDGARLCLGKNQPQPRAGLPVLRGFSSARGFPMRVWGRVTRVRHTLSSPVAVARNRGISERAATGVPSLARRRTQLLEIAGRASPAIMFGLSRLARRRQGSGDPRRCLGALSAMSISVQLPTLCLGRAPAPRASAGVPSIELGSAAARGNASGVTSIARR